MMSIAVCGLGSAARRAHLPALAEEAPRVAARVAAVCDPDPARFAAAPEAQGFTDLELLLDRVRPGLLVIASPPSAHLDAIAAAAARDVDVLCEKPLGLSRGDVDELEAIHRRHPEVLLATVHQYRFSPGWQAISGCLTANADRPFRLRVEVERPGTDPLSAGGWRAAGRREGGILGDHAVHYIALCSELGAAVGVLDCRQAGEPGRETAEVRLSVGAGEAAIRVSYAGERRRNLIEASLAGGTAVRWEGDRLGGSGLDGAAPERRVGALSDREHVNALYADLYAELLAHRLDPAWRERATAETLGVAGLLATCLDAAG